MPRTVPPVLPGGTLRDRAQPSLDTGGGLTLRPWLPDDVAAVVAAYADPAIAFWHHRRFDRTEAAAWIDEAAGGWRDETAAQWAADLDGEVVGRVALGSIGLAIGQAEVSYWTVPAARGRGIARRGLDRLARWALDEVGFWRLELRHSTRNPGSCRVAEAAAFDAEATLRRQHLHDDGWHDVHVHTRFRDDAT